MPKDAEIGEIRILTPYRLSFQTMTSEKTLKIKSASNPKKTSRSALGAPSQLNQSSRKGKKAWRKNVDIGEVEQGLEGLRQEERVTGYTTLLLLHFLIDKF